MSTVSVIICTHNPRPEYLVRVLKALQGQTLSKAHWELLLIDNASTERLERKVDLSWHPRSQHVRENILGLTAARLRGIAESHSRLLLFVDDDNVLEPDYLEAGMLISQGHPAIGAWGGSVRAEFEVAPPLWIRPYLSGLAICEIERDFWSNVPVWSNAVPFGAGLCVRREVADFYAKNTATSPLRRALGRCGKGMAAGEDTDLAFCATDLGMGTGRFCALRLTHLIPRERLTKDYVIRLFAGLAFSQKILRAVRAPAPSSPGQTQASMFHVGLAGLRFCIDYAGADPIRRGILRASWRTKAEARRLIKRHLQGDSFMERLPCSA